MKALVIGGGGFLGRYIVEKLVARGDDVTSLSRNEYPWLSEIGAKSVRADITNRDQVFAACENIDIVFHTSARVGIWGPKKEFYDINVGGTRNVIDGCIRAKVKRLVYTSSPSVIFDGLPHEGIDETYPYPSRHLSIYPETKAIAERETLKANGRGGLYTCSLRPHLIWGPRDTNLVPRLVARAASGKLKIVGDGSNIIDAVYVENAADAHILAGDKLCDGSPAPGQAYFITNGEPVNCWEWINQLLARYGQPPVTKRIEYKTAYLAGAAMELFYKAFGVTSEPVMTRFLAMQLSMSHYFNTDKARRDLGYVPSVGMEEGLSRLKVKMS
ncbi:NAD(P)H steroid dehydrogenase-like protein in alkane synthesis cluster [hydrothermal vent metagenome]|uniref:NAD(P)H steroid dehydrogenase-like protein in alkane synthesis cluster n=1 Tax=hydrothermal vent metagenome TaxID=652676 RepID=A0A3B1CYE4_9ZZZZ